MMKLERSWVSVSSALVAVALVSAGPGCTGEPPSDGGRDEPRNHGSLLGDAAAGPADAGERDPDEPLEEWDCSVEQEKEVDVLHRIGCQRDFESLAVHPSDSSLPGASSVKVIIDRVDDNRLYFQNSAKYPLHYDYASNHLSAVGELPVILDRASFNDNYTSDQRRFYLGAVTFHSGPNAWVFEMAPYDTASVEMITEAFAIVASAAYFGGRLFYHPTGSLSEEVAKGLSAEVPVMTTRELYEGIDYQPLTQGRSCGRLAFYTAADLGSRYVSYQEIVVLEAVPNDISVAQGIITSEFQTPLSHVNVLSQNRGTPNMALRGAFNDPQLRALEGKWVTLEVGPHQPTIVESDPDDQSCMVVPEPIDISPMDLTVTRLTDIEDIYDPESELPMRTQISNAVPAVGGKAAHYSVLARVPEANAPKAFVIPVYYYHQFMAENGFDGRVGALLENEEFKSDPAVRDAELSRLRDEMRAAPVDPEFMATLLDKLNSEYAGVRMRFRSSTNAEDLGNFTGAGLYDSKSGDPSDPTSPVEDAVRKVWSSIWFFRAFEERTYHGIDHMKVGMALLVHRSFPDEDVNGVAATANPFDSAGVEPGFYVNVQVGENSVVQPEPGHTTDQFIYYYELNAAITYLGHSNLVPSGESVLTLEQIHRLGVALKAIHQIFYPAYGRDNTTGWYAMDVEFKFDSQASGDSELYVKQARPYPKR